MGIGYPSTLWAYEAGGVAMDDGLVTSTAQRRFDNRVCLIAGAGGVIAGAVAARLAAEGGTVVGIDRELLDLGFPTYVGDLSVETDLVRVLGEITTDFGRIDVLYNNAGPLDTEDHGLIETTSQTWERVFRNVLTPVVLACKHVVPIMRENGRSGGAIINTGSFLAGMGAATAQVAFSAAKAAVTQLSLDLGTNLARSGIRVNVIAPGPVETPLVHDMFERLGAEETARRLTHVPTGRFATLDEIAGTVAYLASDDAGYVTASVIPVDGGIQGAYTIPD
jgi:NAD(P)-dependent dehydrogenase (short-subunit alcohol dehydrogenase family)